MVPDKAAVERVVVAESIEVAPDGAGVVDG